MKRNTIIYVLSLSTLINTIQCSDSNKVYNACLIGALASGFLYLEGRIIGKYFEKTLPDASPQFQKWAREILAQNGLTDANTVPLKVGNGWAANDFFIRVKAHDVKNLEDILTKKSMHSEVEKKIILADAQYSLLHEKKHYGQADGCKKILLIGLTTGILSQSKDLPDFLVKLGIGIVGNIFYSRYQEQEADRVAFIGTSLDNLIINKLYYDAKTELVDINKSFIPVYDNSLNQETMQMICHRYNSSGNYQLKHKKRLIFEGVSFFSSPSHPSFKSRAELAQECIDLRKKQEQELNTTPKNTEQENFIFRNFVAGI